jgi:hypothetical protein
VATREKAFHGTHCCQIYDPRIPKIDDRFEKFTDLLNNSIYELAGGTKAHPWVEDSKVIKFPDEFDFALKFDMYLVGTRAFTVRYRRRGRDDDIEQTWVRSTAKTRGAYTELQNYFATAHTLSAPQTAHGRLFREYGSARPGYLFYRDMRTGWYHVGFGNHDDTARWGTTRSDFFWNREIGVYELSKDKKSLINKLTRIVELVVQ